eukprot:Skav236472  [mRNA]  locus=scaffold3359:78675:79643:+ [translate_table: standard]
MVKRRLLVLSSLPLGSIKAAFGSTSKAVHPDKSSHPQAHRAMQLVNDAWKNLRDKESRAQYDEELMKKAKKLLAQHAAQSRQQAHQKQRQRQPGPQRKAAAKPVKKDNANKDQKPGPKTKATSTSKFSGKPGSSTAEPTSTAPAAASSSSKPDTGKPGSSTAEPTSTAQAAASSSSKPDSHTASEPPSKKTKSEAQHEPNIKMGSKNSTTDLKEMPKSVGFFDAKEYKSFVAVKAPVSGNVRKFNFADWHSQGVAYKVASHFMRECSDAMHGFDFACKKKDKVDFMAKHGIEPTSRLQRLPISELRDILEEARIPPLVGFLA